jgi:uncharacterized RDD family membrane protein YckC
VGEGQQVSDETYYELIGVPLDAERNVIRERYRERVADLTGQREQLEGAKRPNETAISALRQELADVNRAWQVLADPVQRARYDEGLDPEARSNAARVEADGSALDADLDADDDLDAGDGSEPAERSSNRTPARTTSTPDKPKSRWAQAETQRVPVFTSDGTWLEVAPLGRRLMAAVLDYVPLAALYILIVNIVGNFVDYDRRVRKDGKVQMEPTTDYFVAVGATLAILVVILFVIPTIIRSQTLGKKLTHVMLVDRDTGQAPRISRLLARYLIPVLLVAAIPALGAPVALMLALSFTATRDGTSMLDKFARTAVVIARYRPKRAGAR